MQTPPASEQVVARERTRMAQLKSCVWSRGDELGEGRFNIAVISTISGAIPGPNTAENCAWWPNAQYRLVLGNNRQPKPNLGRHPAALETESPRRCALIAGG
jgi:hypothetical protein